MIKATFSVSFILLGLSMLILMWFIIMLFDNNLRAYLSKKKKKYPITGATIFNFPNIPIDFYPNDKEYTRLAKQIFLIAWIMKLIAIVLIVIGIFIGKF